MESIKRWFPKTTVTITAVERGGIDYYLLYLNGDIKQMSKRGRFANILLEPGAEYFVAGVVKGKGEGEKDLISYIPSRIETTPPELSKSMILGRPYPSGEEIQTQTDQELKEIRKVFGFNLRYGKRGEAVLTSSYRSMCVGIHEQPSDLQRHLLSQTGANPEIFTLQLFSFPSPNRHLKQILRRRLKSTRNNLQRQLINLIISHYSQNERPLRLLTVSSPRETVLNKEGEITGLAGAKPLNSIEWSLLARSAQKGNYTSQGNPGEHPLIYADCQPQMNPDGSLSQGHNPSERTRYWRVEVASPEELESLIRMEEIQITAQCQNKSGYFWVTIVISATGDDEFLSRLENSLPGKTTPIRSFNRDNHNLLEQTHYASLPGSPNPFPNQIPQVISWWQEFLGIFSQVADAVCPQGDILIGKTKDEDGKGRNLFLQSNQINSLILTGPSGSGKSVWAQIIAQSFQRSVFVHCSPPQEGWTGLLAKRSGGQDLQFSSSNINNRENLERETSNLVQHIKSRIEEDRKKWKEGDFSGLPMSVRMIGGNYYPYLTYLKLFCEEYLPEMAKYLSERKERTVLILDDISVLRDIGNDPQIGEMAEQIVKSLRSSILNLINICRKYGIFIILTAHSIKDFTEIYGSGALRDLSWGINFPVEEKRIHREGEMFYPPETDPEKPIGENPGNRGGISLEIPRSILDLLGVPK